MGRTRRSAIDGGFEQSGSDWFVESGTFLFFNIQGFQEFSLPFDLQLGVNQPTVNTITLWNLGVLSLGPATQAQIDFMANGFSPILGPDNPGFPGDFFIFDFDGNPHQSFSYGIGAADYEFPFDSFGRVNAAFFTFDENFQIIIDENGFAILDEFAFTDVTNGYFIGGAAVQGLNEGYDFATFPDFFTYSGTSAADTMSGSEYNERFISSLGADVISGGGGNDLVSYANSPQSVSVNLALGVNTGGFAAGDVLIDILDVEGSQSADTLTGNDLANRLFGLGGRDTIRGGGGDDFIAGGAEGDILDGGPGTDWLSYEGSTAAVEVSLRDSTATGGSATGDVISNFEAVLGSSHDDAIEGSSGSDNLDGADGEDALFGLQGDDFLRGGAGDDFLDGGAGADFISGGGGFDTVSYAGSAAAVTIDLAAGIFQGGDAAGDLLFDIGAVIGSRLNDRLSAAFFGSRLDGGAGADILTGRSGNDVLIGGFGNDTLNGDSGNDTLLGGDGDDTIDAGAGSDTLTGGAGADVLQGRAGNDFLSGDDGNDMLLGGTGSDVMAGGAGDDTYNVDTIGDIIQENVGGGFDVVRSRGSYTLTLGAEVEQLTTLAIGGTTAINLTGNELANEVIGNAGNNILRGGGGNDTLRGAGGDDRLIGGTGNDTYYVDSQSDIVQEGAGEGTDDRVQSVVTYTLAAGVQVERLSTTDDAGTTAIGLTGNELANAITGNAGTNVLDGSGGNDVLSGLAGADTLIGGGGDDTLDGGIGIDSHAGGTGNDTYLVETAGDVIVEAVGEGNDRVLASVNYTLAAGVEVEQLATTNADGSVAIALTGNEFGNIITGNAGASALSGNSGDDTLNGGGGNDTLRGGIGNDTLIGGAGNDTLTGGTGNDFFRFSAALGPGNVDQISDYAAANDTIQLDRTVFTGLTAGVLASGAFTVGSAAVDADDRIVYDQTTGRIWFDADGNGAGAAIHFATVSAGLVLTSGEFVVL